MKAGLELKPQGGIRGNIRLTIFIVLCETTLSFAQTSKPAAIQSQAASFLTFAPDARAAGMGDAGVASSVDANATYWNASKLGFAEREFGAGVSYTPSRWTVEKDRWLGYFSAYKKLGQKRSVAISLSSFRNDYVGQFPSANPIDPLRTNRLMVGGTYAQLFGDNFAMGLTLKYIASNISGRNIVNGIALKSAGTVGGDLSAYYRKSYRNNFKCSAGAVVSNFGGKVNYGYGQIEGYIPTALRIGTGLSFPLKSDHSISFIFETNKFLTSTPDSNGYVVNKPVVKNVFSSFPDAHGDFKEKIQAIGLSVGAEYLYKNVLAFRCGYYREAKNRADRKYFTTGVGFRLFKNYQADFSYLIPAQEFSPLARTFRLSLAAYLGAKSSLIGTVSN